MPNKQTTVSDQKSVLRAATLGFVAGLRSQIPLSALTTAAQNGRFAAHTDSPLRYLQARWTGPILSAMAVGEIVADKLPFVPSRIEPAPLAGREIIGGIAGMAVFTNDGRSLPLGLAIGAAGAAAGSFGGYYARSFLSKRTGLPDLIWAITEDVFAIGLGRLAVHHYLRS